MHDIIKYPRTEHIEGSRLQKGDEDLNQVPRRELVGKYLVIEEKEDGANSGISTPEYRVRLQSRGHYLTGGPRETQFTLFKQWANMHGDDFALALGERYVAYGEWLQKKHTVYYDALAHYWKEFDILDRERTDYPAYIASKYTDSSKLWFLSTDERAKLLAGVKYEPVKVLWQGIWTKDMRFEDFIVKSAFKTDRWRENLRAESDRLGYDWDLVWKHTDHSDLSEGLYIKWEQDGRVMGRYKFVRHDFVSLIVSNDEHHENLPPVPNKLADGVDIFAV